MKLRLQVLYRVLKEERERRVGDFRCLLSRSNEHNSVLDGLKDKRLDVTIVTSRAV